MPGTHLFSGNLGNIVLFAVSYVNRYLVKEKGGRE